MGQFIAQPVHLSVKCTARSGRGNRMKLYENGQMGYYELQSSVHDVLYEKDDGPYDMAIATIWVTSNVYATAHWMIHFQFRSQELTSEMASAALDCVFDHPGSASSIDALIDDVTFLSPYKADVLALRAARARLQTGSTWRLKMSLKEDNEWDEYWRDHVDLVAKITAASQRQHSRDPVDRFVELVAQDPDGTKMTMNRWAFGMPTTHVPSFGNMRPSWHGFSFTAPTSQSGAEDVYFRQNGYTGALDKRFIFEQFGIPLGVNCGMPTLGDRIVPRRSSFSRAPSPKKLYEACVAHEMNGAGYYLVNDNCQLWVKKLLLSLGGGEVELEKTVACLNTALSWPSRYHPKKLVRGLAHAVPGAHLFVEPFAHIFTHADAKFTGVQ